MKRSLVALLLLAPLAACHHHTTFAKLVEDGGKIEAELYGEGAHLTAGGDLLEIRGGEVRVNGASCGAVGEGQVVRYTIVEGHRELTVDGLRRDTSSG